MWPSVGQTYNPYTSTHMRVNLDVADEVGAGASFVAFRGGAFSVLVGDVHQETNVARLRYRLHDQIGHVDLRNGRKKPNIKMAPVWVIRRGKRRRRRGNETEGDEVEVDEKKLRFKWFLFP